MENRLAVFEGADVTEDFLQHLAGFSGVLADAVAGVGVRADGDNLPSQLPETPEIVRRRKIPSTAVHPAGVHLQPLALVGQGAQNFVDNLGVVSIGQGGVHRAALALVQIGHVGQHVIIASGPDTGQHPLEVLPLGLEDGFPLPIGGEIDVQIIHEMYRAQHKVVVSPGNVPGHLRLVVGVEAVFHSPADFHLGGVQMVILPAVVFLSENHGLLLGTPDIVHVVGKADFPQTGPLGGHNHGLAGVVAVEGNPGMHMIVKHGQFPPKIVGMLWAEPPDC